MKKRIVVSKEDAAEIVAAINAGELKSVRAISARIMPKGFVVDETFGDDTAKNAAAVPSDSLSDKDDRCNPEVSDSTTASGPVDKEEVFLALEAQPTPGLRITSRILITTVKREYAEHNRVLGSSAYGRVIAGTLTYPSELRIVRDGLALSQVIEINEWKLKSYSHHKPNNHKLIASTKLAGEGADCCIIISRYPPKILPGDVIESIESDWS